MVELTPAFPTPVFPNERSAKQNDSCPTGQESFFFGSGALASRVVPDPGLPDSGARPLAVFHPLLGIIPPARYDICWENHPEPSPAMRFRPYSLTLAALVIALCAEPLHAQVVNQQFGNAPQPQNVPLQNVMDGPNQGLNANSQQATTGNSGGAASADFDSLIDLIQSTVAVDTWAETGGGEAEIRPFPTGVMVDAAGTLKLLKATAPTAALAERRGTAPPATSTASADVRRASKLRYVSLPRLEREIIRRQEAHAAFEPALLTLAGLQRVQYLFVYPSSDISKPGDLVLAGPAGDWRVDPFGRIVSTDTGEPIVRLDDFLTLFRRVRQSNASFFGCAINPRQESLAATQAYLDKTAARPLEPSRRDAWLEKLRDTLGRQDVEIFGIDPTSRVARVLVEADVHMKLVGMGLEDGVPGVESYLDAVKASGTQPSAMSVLRWWFALHYAAIRTSPAGDGYELVGDGVRVLSENELLAAQGQRVHTGQSDPLNQQFADRFTAHFAALADKYPVYGELRTIFDLSLAVALIQSDKLADRANWKPTRLVDNEKLRLPQWPVPREVDTVANCIEVSRRQIVAGVSGGVMVDTQATLANRTGASDDTLTTTRSAAPGVLAEPDSESITWWWDAKP